MIAPKNLPILGVSLHIQNHENCCVEESNDECQFLTICCHNDHANWAPLCSHFSIMMTKSKEFAKSIGLVPVFIQVHLDDLKEKGKIQGIAGSLVLKHPIIWTAGQHPEVAIPNVICQTMACGFKLPLQFFLNLPTSSVWLGVYNNWCFFLVHL